MEEMYQAALNLLRIVEHYDTDGTPDEQAMASNIISEYRQGVGDLAMRLCLDHDSNFAAIAALWLG